jgi:tetratricopeptide (TPR) repeat protein
MWRDRRIWVLAGLIGSTVAVWGLWQLGAGAAVLEMESNIRVERAANKLDSGDLAGAIADLDIAVQKAPTHSEPYALRGRAHLLLAIRDNRRGGGPPSHPEELAAAHSDLAHALLNDANNPDAHRFMAELLWNQERHADAFSEFTRSLELDGSNAATWWERGNAYGWVGDHAQAIADFDRAVTLRGSFDDFLWRGVSKIEVGDCAGGRQDLQEAQRRASSSSAKDEALAELEKANGRCQ